PDPLELATHRHNLAEARHALGHHRHAEQLLEGVISTLEDRLGPGHAELAIPYKARGSVALALGRPEAAEEDLRRSLEIHSRAEQSPVEAAETRWLHARSLDALGRRSDALAQATIAAEELEGLGPELREDADEIRAWIRDVSEPTNSRTR
ncbi:MAG: tetratricopeptide repeat protein, partial [Nannocystaceae bacterium]